jgi:hypothetical protein
MVVITNSDTMETPHRPLTQSEILELYSPSHHRLPMLKRLFTGIVGSSLSGGSMSVRIYDPGDRPEKKVVDTIVRGYSRTGIAMRVDESNAIIEDAITVVAEQGPNIVTYQIDPKPIEDIPALQMYKGWNTQTIRQTAAGYLPNVSPEELVTAYVTRFSTNLENRTKKSWIPTPDLRHLRIARSIRESKKVALRNPALSDVHLGILITTETRAETFAKGLDVELKQMPNDFDKDALPFSAFMTNDFVANNYINDEIKKAELEVNRNKVREEFSKFIGYTRGTNHQLTIDGPIEEQASNIQLMFLKYISQKPDLKTTADYIFQHLMDASDRAHIYVIPLKR